MPCIRLCLKLNATPSKDEISKIRQTVLTRTTWGRWFAQLGLLAALWVSSIYPQDQSDWCSSVSQPSLGSNGNYLGGYEYVVCPDGSRAVMFTTFNEDPRHPQQYIKVWDADGNATYWFAWWSANEGGIRTVSQTANSGGHYLPDDFPYDNLSNIPPDVLNLHLYHTALDITAL